jgi:hypothetical protein
MWFSLSMLSCLVFFYSLIENILWSRSILSILCYFFFSFSRKIHHFPPICRQFLQTNWIMCIILYLRPVTLWFPIFWILFCVRGTLTLTLLALCGPFSARYYNFKSCSYIFSDRARLPIVQGFQNIKFRVWVFFIGFNVTPPPLPPHPSSFVSFI